METSSIFTICFGLGAILLLLAISYSYDKSSPNSKRITNLFWILGDLFLVVGLFGRYQAGHDAITSGVMLIIVNYFMWKRIKNEKENSNPDS